jgi:hypothetical protein
LQLDLAEKPAPAGRYFFLSMKRKFSPLAVRKRWFCLSFLAVYHVMGEIFVDTANPHHGPLISGNES